MLRNYLKIAFRNLLRYKGYSLINITGFAILLGIIGLVISLAGQDILADITQALKTTS